MMGPPWHGVYWASHGCYKKPGHKKACRCICHAKLPKGVEPYGNDVSTAIAKGSKRKKGKVAE